ncbi:MAG: hypothetical protein DSY76_01505 [Bacteroidetes bacterium]|nr:MAG: hypothetical protein DSY76_01505 [Bacteroidota bacterium]
MKTILLFFIGVFTFVNIQAQDFFYYLPAQQSSKYQDNWQYYFAKYQANYEGMMNLVFYSGKDIDKNLKSKEDVIYHFKKGVKQETPSSKSIFKYDNGLLMSHAYYKKGKLKKQLSFEYNEDGYYTRFLRGLVNSPKHEEQLLYNDSNRVIQYSSFNKKHKLKRKYVIKYNDNQQIIRQDIYDGAHINPKTTWVYKYNEEGKRIQTEHYKKGKLKSKWVYSCDDEGTKVKENKVDTKTSCSIVEHNNDGSYVKIYRTTDSKGKIIKNRWTYNKDSLLIAYELINPKGVIVRKYTNEYDEKGNIVVYTYYKKGGEKISHRSKFKYNDDKKILEKLIYNGKGKLKSKKQFEYDKQGNTTSYAYYNSKGEQQWKYEYTYNEKGELVSDLTYKKGKLYAQHNVVFAY